MARRLSTPVLPAVGAPPKYPWHHWADGSAWRITHGKDFDISASSMAAIIRSHARRNGLQVRTRRVGTAIEFQFSVAQEQAA